MRQWILVAALIATPLGCVSSPSDALFKGDQSSSTGGWNNFSGLGGAPGTGGAIQGTGGVPMLGSGGIPIMGMGGIVSTGGFNFAGSPLDGAWSTGGFIGTGGFSPGGAGPFDAGSFGGTNSTDARPDARDECPSGHYAGTLTGPYRATLGNTTFTARLEFTVEPAGTIAGTLIGTSDSTSRATLSGSVDCKTRKVTISIVNGTYRNILGTTQYAGKMTATFDTSTSSFTDGKWEITEPNSTGSGSGTWSAS